MNEEVYYNSSLGWIRIRNDDQAICELTFADKNADMNLYADKKRKVKPSSTIIKRCIQQLDEYFAGKRFNFDLPVSQPGTSFQQSVWAGLLKIEYGKTLSYLSFSKK